ncbi:hypothetical protein T4E_10917 [Trichinella pseudospiralis]|uniref:Uncharacterized protein n=1 Tax=Trichinella pseudospiralis TaxID=6337 RepID=A0A0V0Y2V4_TRIPS|nr:hypothetical protein T4E_10917 [Trichinella pseudospiralis]
MKNSVLKFIRLQSALNIRCMCVLRKLRISVILAASIHKSQPPMPYNLTVIRFRHYVLTQILRCSHAVLNCASLQAEVLTCPD